MGQLPSLHIRKEGKGITTSSFAESDPAPVVRPWHNHFVGLCSEIMRRKAVPDVFLVYEKPSSQYIDEDGDTAHEFYTEKESVNGQPRQLHRVLNNLRPKGKERYSIPRLSSDVPVVIWEVDQEPS